MLVGRGTVLPYKKLSPSDLFLRISQSNSNWQQRTLAPTLAEPNFRKHEIRPEIKKLCHYGLKISRKLVKVFWSTKIRLAFEWDERSPSCTRAAASAMINCSKHIPTHFVNLAYCFMCDTYSSPTNVHLINSWLWYEIANRKQRNISSNMNKIKHITEFNKHVKYHKHILPVM